MGTEPLGAHCDHLGHGCTGQLIASFLQRLSDLPQDVP